MNQSGVSIRRATIDDALSVESLASLLATTFSIDRDAFTVIFERVINDEDSRILVSVDERGTVNGYLLGFMHDAFFANGPVAESSLAITSSSDSWAVTNSQTLPSLNLLICSARTLRSASRSVLPPT